MIGSNLYEVSDQRQFSVIDTAIEYGLESQNPGFKSCCLDILANLSRNGHTRQVKKRAREVLREYYRETYGTGPRALIKRALRKVTKRAI